MLLNFFKRVPRTLVIAGVALAFSMTFVHGAAAKYASIVIEESTGEVLYSRNADTKNYPASLTKLMTLYLLFEALDAHILYFDDILTVSVRAAGQPPSKLGLRKGNKISVHDAILALVVKSANDVATVVAEELGGTEVEFAKMMTAKARSLDMSNTTFRNASGLPNKRQLSSARDIATLAFAMRRDFPHYYHYFSMPEFDFGTKKIRTHNRMLADYPGTDGLKTGYTHASGFNIAISVERNGDRLIGVVFGGNTAASRDRHMEKLLDQSFAVLDERRAEQARAREAIIESAPPLRLVGETSRFDGSWGIQIGAYQSIDAATRALQFANYKIPDLLAPAGPALVPIEHNGHTLYRARYLGLDPDQAKGACRHLAGSAIPCFVVRQSEEDKTLALTSS